MNIIDSDGVAINFVNLAIDEASDSPVIVGYVPTVAGMYLTADSTLNARIMARVKDSGGPFVDIETTPIPLDQFGGVTTAFDFIVRVSAVVGIEQAALSVRVTYNP